MNGSTLLLGLNAVIWAGMFYSLGASQGVATALAMAIFTVTYLALAVIRAGGRDEE